MSVRYPSAVDYTLALQHPAAAFRDPELRGSVFAQGFMGPEGIAGSSAVVFRATIGGSDYALRCYTRQDASSPERYAAFDDYITVAQLGRYVGAVAWFDREVLVKGAWWPVLRMEWIVGRHLNEYVGRLADEGDAAALGALASRWLALVCDLQRASFAHGDLQHGNILVDDGGNLRLVDFDSVWIPPLQGQSAPTETGHPSYQPQDVSAESRWGPSMDTFPGLVVYLALTALAKAPALWDKLNNGDNLLFERRDFVPPHNTEAWTLLAGLADPEVDRLAAKLREFCAPGSAVNVTLEEAVGPRPATGEARRPDRPRQEPAGPKQNWWELTGASPAVTARGSEPALSPPATPATPFHTPFHTPVPDSEATPPPRPADPYRQMMAPRPAAPAPVSANRTAPPWTFPYSPRTGTGPAFPPAFPPAHSYAPRRAAAPARAPRPGQRGLVVLRGFGVAFIIGGFLASAFVTESLDIALGQTDGLMLGIALGALLVIIGVVLIMLRPEKRWR